MSRRSEIYAVGSRGVAQLVRRAKRRETFTSREGASRQDSTALPKAQGARKTSSRSPNSPELSALSSTTKELIVTIGL
jgi:hypothetical protein